MLLLFLTSSTSTHNINNLVPSTFKSHQASPLLSSLSLLLTVLFFILGNCSLVYSKLLAASACVHQASYVNLAERTVVFDLHRGRVEIAFKAVVLPRHLSTSHSPAIDLHPFFLQVVHLLGGIEEGVLNRWRNDLIDFVLRLIG